MLGGGSNFGKAKCAPFPYGERCDRHVARRFSADPTQKDKAQSFVPLYAFRCVAPPGRVTGDEKTL